MTEKTIRRKNLKLKTGDVCRQEFSISEFDSFSAFWRFIVSRIKCIIYLSLFRRSPRPLPHVITNVTHVLILSYPRVDFVLFSSCVLLPTQFRFLLQIAASVILELALQQILVCPITFSNFKQTLNWSLKLKNRALVGNNRWYTARLYTCDMQNLCGRKKFFSLLDLEM